MSTGRDGSPVVRPTDPGRIGWSRWGATIEMRVDTAGALHAGWPSVREEPGRARLAVCTPTGTAVVLGSTQNEQIVDHDRAILAGVDVVRRRSGGGAVMVGPHDPLWVDAWVPRGDPRWDDDAARAFDWFGTWWSELLTRAGCQGVSVHRGSHRRRSRWASTVCFGGLGRGEVLDPVGRKVVGMSQRRDRHGAWFHGACILRWDADPLLAVLALSPGERDAARSELDGLVTGVGRLLPGRPRPHRARELLLDTIFTGV